MSRAMRTKEKQKQTNKKPYIFEPITFNRLLLKDLRIECKDTFNILGI